MAEAVVAFVLKQLSTFLSREYAHLRGLRPGLQFINDELGAMRAFLRNVEAEVEQHPQLQEWVKQVRDAAYDIEDVIDELMLVFARCNRGGVLKNIYTTIETLGARHRIFNKINDIKCRVKDISDRHQRYKKDYGIQGAETSIVAEDMAVREIRQRALLLEEADLVGIQVHKNELLSHIFDDNSHLKVISIVGMGGIGKTTLIRRVYEDAKVKEQFGSHAWVTISQTFEIKSVLKELIEKLHYGIKEQVPQEVESKGVDDLKLFLRDFLRERRYIIILDDIWSIDAWEALKYALPDCNCGSRIMVTTRIADVASASRGDVYRMEALSDEESWTLFCSRSFENKCCPPYLKNVSQRILNKCQGLPLAIVSISGLLFLKDKNILEEWEKVYRSLGSELEGTGRLDHVKKILLLSYNDLPYYLKHSLLYISFYPEDYWINSSYTIAQWISEGLVQDRAGLSRREIGEEYIKELLNRSLFQVVSKDVDGSVTYFCIHDLVREIILSKAKEHGIITEVKGRYIEGLNNVRRLIIHDFFNDALEDIQINHLRSLILIKYGYGKHMSTSSFLKLLCDRSKLIKVLILSYSSLENIPKEVFKLFHLKFLDLARSQVKIISKFIKNLPNLEYLNLADTKVTELPAEILGLGKLRQLYVFQEGDHSNIHGFRAPNEIGGLVSLEHLLYMVADNRKIVTEIGKLSQLRELGITELRREDGKQLCCTLEKLTNLRDFDVRSIKADEILDLQHSMSTVPQFLQLLKLVGRLEQMPRWIPSAQGLTQLQFARSELMEDPLEYLHVLPNLLLLELTQAYGGETLCFKAKGFQKLKQLRLEQLQRLRHVTIEEGAMPHLEVLTIVDCELVEELPQGIQNLSELQTVELNDMSEEVIAELRENMKKARNTGFSMETR